MARGAGHERLAQYKRRGAGGQEARRKQAAAERKDAREQRRTLAFTANRKLETVPLSREEKLKEWKNKKETNRKMTTTKPAFIVGKITYNDMHLYKPPESTTFRPPQGLKPLQTPLLNRPTRKLTRRQKGPAQAVQDAIKNFAFGLSNAPEENYIKENQQQSVQKGKQNDVAELLNTTFDGTQTLCTKTTVNKEIPQLEEQISFQVALSGKRDTRSRQQAIVLETNEAKALDAQSLEENLKPRKLSSRRKRQKSETTSKLGDDSSRIVVASEPVPTPSVEVLEDSDQKSADYFRSLYDGAVSKLNDLSTKWTNFQTQGLPSKVCDQVDVAVGYAQLLISQKLQQFRNLITEHENINYSTELKVLSTDLDGFWGLVNYQVEDVYKKFEKLETLKQNDWHEDTQPVTHAKARRTAPKMAHFKGNATSGLRSFLAQARKKTQLDEVENSNSVLDRFDIAAVAMPKPMSPVVMRVGSRAKLLGSPAVSVPARSPLHSVNRADDVNLLLQTPKSSKKTPYRKTVVQPQIHIFLYFKLCIENLLSNNNFFCRLPGC